MSRELQQEKVKTQDLTDRMEELHRKATSLTSEISEMKAVLERLRLWIGRPVQIDEPFDRLLLINQDIRPR
jgi:hypothetical protein